MNWTSKRTQVVLKLQFSPLARRGYDYATSLTRLDGQRITNTFSVYLTSSTRISVSPQSALFHRCRAQHASYASCAACIDALIKRQ